MRVTICDICRCTTDEMVFISLQIGPDRLTKDVCRGCVDAKALKAVWDELERICDRQADMDDDVIH